MTRYFYHIEGREEINFLSSDIMTAEEAQKEVSNMCFGENEGVTLYRAYIFDDKDVEGFDVEEYIEDSFNGCDDTFKIKEIGCKPSVKTPLYREYVIKGDGILMSFLPALSRLLNGEKHGGVAAAAESRMKKMMA